MVSRFPDAFAMCSCSVGALTTLLVVSACDRPQEEKRLEKASIVLTPVAATPSDPVSAQPAPPSHWVDSPCPEGMLHVAGSYCPSVISKCLEYHPEYAQNPSSPTVSDRCLRYEKPSRCMAARREMAFCMDRFEYPNRVGEKPRVLTTYGEARALCEAQQKRLCTEDEFNFACEGPEMLPYATGYERDSEKCNFDRTYVRPDHTRRMKTYDACLLDERCATELERLDQRHAIGSRLECASFAGVVDLNGNVNEWVTREGEKPPNRSGLKGGWWGPVRDRCRPTVRFHKEGDYGYEVGFRCCADERSAKVSSAPKR